MALDLYYRPISCPPTQAELATLAQLRTAAGWYLDRINQWELEVATRQRYIWFIHFTNPLAMVMGTMADTPAIGMVSLLLENPMDPSLASYSTTSRVEITSLFVLASYRHLGVGIVAVQEMERRAKSFGASKQLMIITLDTNSRSYAGWVTLNTPATERSLTIFGNLGYHEYKVIRPSVTERHTPILTRLTNRLGKPVTRNPRFEVLACPRSARPPLSLKRSLFEVVRETTYVCLDFRVLYSYVLLFAI